MHRPSPDSGFVIAADSGGTHTRVACFALDGSLLASATGRGGSPYHDDESRENVTETTRACLASAGLAASDARALVAGLASVSRAGSNQGEGDNRWTEEYFLLPGMTCPRLVLNDAVVAHRGALLWGAGIVVVAGTGSMILGILDDGTEIESGQFEHYAGAARHLAYDAVQSILVGPTEPEDAAFVSEVLSTWDVADIPSLRSAILSLTGTDRKRLRRLYGVLAPIITAAADSSPLADRVLRDLAARTARGIHLLAPLISSDAVRVALTGAVATTDAFARRLSNSLASHPSIRIEIVPAALDPVRGAAFLALGAAGVDVDAAVIDRLRVTS